jgi:hypothetical protein
VNELDNITAVQATSQNLAAISAIFSEFITVDSKKWQIWVYWLTGKWATRTHLAQYHMNVVTEAQCKRFIARVDDAMRRFGR